MIPTPRADNLVWIDLEMTGLDATVDVVLQAALVITNADLEPLDEVAVDVGQPEAALAAMSPFFVRDMHARTGSSTAGAPLDGRRRRGRAPAARARHRLVSIAGDPVRELDLERPPLHRALHARPRRVSALPRRRRVEPWKVCWPSAGTASRARLREADRGRARRRRRRQTLHRRAAPLPPDALPRRVSRLVVSLPTLVPH